MKTKKFVRVLCVCDPKGPDYWLNSTIDTDGEMLDCYVNGQGSLLDNRDLNVHRWMVVKVARGDITTRHHRSCFSRGKILFSGPRVEATSAKWFPSGLVVGATRRAGAFGTAATGDGGGSVAGTSGTAISGAFGVSKAGYGGVAVSGHRGSSFAGGYGKAFAGNAGMATCGAEGMAVSGVNGLSVAAGEHAVASTGNGGVVSGMKGGVLLVKYYSNNCLRVAVGYVGEDGIEPNIEYKVNSVGGFVPAEGA